ncbi:MAG TPA: DUF4380 domain-containing protein [Vicinamibacteria bacterium]|nr:DUF4380 domain-containing protein [Vicinamibacteria bacterium]
MTRRPGGGVAAGLVLAAALATGASGQGKGDAGMELIELTSGKLVVGVVPPLGGRVVLLKAAAGENLLDSDPKRWKPPYPPPMLGTPFQPWNGRIVWVGPQTGFWSQQDLRPELKAAKAGWPPDPFNETGRFDVVEKTATLLKLKGATSPVTGLAFEHEYEITGERTVRMKATATNGRAAPVSWDLWPNTRVRPEGFPYVLPDPLQMLRMDGPALTDGEAGAYPSEVRGGWLTLPPGKKADSGRQRLWAKAYVRPARGLIAYFLGPHLLLIRAPIVPREKLHGEQAFIEVYRGVGRGADSILELEMHGPYEALAPGASTSFEQTFEVLDYDGPPTPEGHVARLEALR